MCAATRGNKPGAGPDRPPAKGGELGKTFGNMAAWGDFFNSRGAVEKGKRHSSRGGRYFLSKGVRAGMICRVQTLWAVYVVCFVLAPFLVAVTGGNFSVWVFLVFLGLPVLFTMVAQAMGVGWLEFWSVPAAAALPWVLSLALVLGCAQLLPKNLQQAAGMSAMAPLLGLLGSAATGFFSTLVLGPEIPLADRIRRPLMISAPLALLVTVFLMCVFYQDTRAERKPGAGSDEKPASAEADATPQPAAPPDAKNY